MSIISYSEHKGFTIDFNINKGEDKKQWYVEFDICLNPICSCQEMTIELYDTKNKKTTLPKHRFKIDVLAQKAAKLEGENATSKEDFQLTKLFVENLSENDWDQLQKYFLTLKRKTTESAPIKNLHVSFPEKEIENDGVMIGYHEIFPYADELWLELDDIKYLLDDQYCLSSTCSCTHAVLTFIAMKNGQALGKSNSLVIMFDYKTNSYKVENRGPKNIAAPKELVKEFLRKHFKIKLKERHKKLRFLYNNSRKNKRKTLKQSLNKPLLSTKTNKQKKIGRNAPCPCGSGKKYKKCCMLKK